MSAPVDVLKVIGKVAIFNGGLIADDLERVEDALQKLLAAGRALSADVEHALAVASFNGVDVAKTPLRQSLDAFDAAIARCGGAA